VSLWNSSAVNVGQRPCVYLRGSENTGWALGNSDFAFSSVSPTGQHTCGNISSCITERVGCPTLLEQNINPHPLGAGCLFQKSGKLAIRQPPGEWRNDSHTTPTAMPQRMIHPHQLWLALLPTLSVMYDEMFPQVHCPVGDMELNAKSEFPSAQPVFSEPLR